jgi:CDP-diacylglycerol--glycerol-3-phosphate 3-phosphatidyltransferase
MSRHAKFAFVTFLTFMRFPLVLMFFAGAILYTSAAWRVPWLFALTFASLIASALTDLFDGYFARRFEVVTKLGAHADPLMDKFFYLASLPLLAFVAAIQPGNTFHARTLLVITLLFLARDQWVTFLRSIGAIYSVSGKANWSGKLRTAINFPMICVVYHYEEAPPQWQFIPVQFVYAFEFVALVITIVSLYIYTRNYWPYLRRSASIKKENQPQTD